MFSKKFKNRTRSKLKKQFQILFYISLKNEHSKWIYLYTFKYSIIENICQQSEFICFKDDSQPDFMKCTSKHCDQLEIW